MFIKTIILILVIFKSGECIKKSCSDCTFVQDCPEAEALKSNRDPEIIRRFKKSTCDWIETKNKRWIRKVCCSDFSDLVVIHNNSALLPEKCGEKYQGRIIGGGFPGLYDYPWIALLYYETFTIRGKTFPKLRCGGTIINSRYILTAAHCINNRDRKKLRVRVGEYNIRSDCDFDGSGSYTVCESYVKDYIVQNITVHEQYAKKNKSNDIALLRVGEPFDFEHKNVAPICLPVPDNLLRVRLDGKIATVAGWGKTNTGRNSLRLQDVEIPIWTETRCRSYLINEVSSFDINDPMKTLCAGVQGKDSCNGDSGGPLMLQEEYNNNMRMILFGVVSAGPTICGSGDPGKYTEVTKYVKWILDNIKA